ncbi:unnamed protein product [Phytophthora lilii]|uniref:Unnamed protein product n=1 Tax=Phytophthora lilii TaxID=2077276 RepID=A0A9W6TU46_9STRA|nr:unnamed protein product [Phytophthora lilii]
MQKLKLPSSPSVPEKHPALTRGLKLQPLIVIPPIASTCTHPSLYGTTFTHDDVTIPKNAATPPPLTLEFTIERHGDAGDAGAAGRAAARARAHPQHLHPGARGPRQDDAQRQPRVGQRHHLGAARRQGTQSTNFCVRYLDNTEEEQVRGITMKSSAISLVYQPEPVADKQPEAPFLINLVDSPGHVDFSFDVSTAVRLCDGALVLIDAVEGVCAQTHAVIRQAWKEGIRPCLVINKMDRLIFELQFSPMEAYQRLNRILEQANAVLSSMIRMDVLEKYDQEADAGEKAANGEEGEEVTADKIEFTLDDEAISKETEQLENEMLFSPANGNVIFASATDGWAFGIGYFAALYAKKLELPVRAMRQALWGEYYYNGKTKKIVTKPPTSNSQTMFCSFILELIWTTYTSLAKPVESDADLEALRKLTRQLRVAKLVTDRDLKQSDRKNATQAVMRRWLPLSTTVLKMVTRVLPSPVTAQVKRAEKLCTISPEQLEKSSQHSQVFRSLQTCQTFEEAPLVIYICKVLSVEANVLSDYHQSGLAATDEVYVGVGRVYSGVLREGQPVYVMDPKFQGVPGDVDVETIDPNTVKHVARIESGLIKPYMMMGRDLHKLDRVPAGNIVGIVGLQEHVLKTATLSSTLACPSLTKMPYQAKPIVRVAVEPEDPRNFGALEAGLQRLYRSDPTVEVHVQETGEHVIVALGELHLERCIKDLKERFAKVAVQVSEPLVGFRESIVEGTISSFQENIVFKDLLSPEGAKEDASDNDTEQTDENQDPKVALGTTPDGSLTLKLRALPLPLETAKLLEESAALLKRITVSRKAAGEVDDVDISVEVEAAAEDIATFKKKLEKSLQESENMFLKSLPLDQIWSCGPRRVGPNLLINNIPDYHATGCLFPSNSAAEVHGPEKAEQIRKLENSIVTGFQMASSAGPLCDEPVWGVAFIIEDVTFLDNEEEADEEKADASKYGPLSGQVISTMRTTCLMSFVKQPVRLVEAVYECTVQCQAEQLGKLYSVISKRRGDIYSEELSDGTALFTVKAHLPVVESFGFATDLLIQTSGAASNPQLIFSHWSIIDMDPFFQPQTEEEREDYGERVYEHNYVRRYIEAVRKRKGLSRDEKIVVHAEKQPVYPSLQPDEVISFGASWNYSVFASTKAEASSGSTTARVWSYKYDSTSITWRAFASYLTVPDFPTCFLYTTECPEQTFDGYIAFKMIDSLVNAVSTLKDDPLKSATLQPGPIGLTLRSESEYIDRLHQFIFPKWFTNINWRTNQVLYYSPQLLVGTNSRTLCFPTIGSKTHKPRFCNELWTNFNRSCAPNDLAGRGAGLLYVHTMDRLRKIQAQFPNSSVDLTLLESQEDMQICRGGLTSLGFRRSDVSAIVRARDCSVNEKTRSCETVFVEDYRYETGLLISDVVQWYKVVAALRLIGQSYFLLRGIGLMLSCYFVHDSTKTQKKMSTWTRVRKARHLFMKVPTQCVVFGSPFPVTCYVFAHLLDAPFTYDVLESHFISQGGVLDIHLESFISYAVVQMRNVWIYALIWHMVVTATTSRWLARSNQLSSGIIGVPEFLLSAFSSITLVAQYRSTSFRSSKVLSLMVLPDNIGRAWLATKYQYSFTHRGSGSVLLGGVIIDLKFLICLVFAVAGAWTVRVIWVSYWTTQHGVDKYRFSHWFILAPTPIHKYKYTAPSARMNVNTFRYIQHQMKCLHGRSDDVEANVAFMNAVVMSDPIVYMRTLLGRDRSTELAYFQSLLRPHQVVLLPVVVVGDHNEYTGKLKLLRRVNASELTWPELVQCG